MPDLNSQTLAIIESGFMIPARPDIIVSIQHIIDSDCPSMSDAADLIVKDVGLSAAVLKASNSPLYGQPRQISDIRQASSLLGFDTLKLIINSEMLQRSFPQHASISLERFWDAAEETATAMIYICRKLHDQIPVEDLYTLGLFHDCGIPAFAAKYADYRKVLIEANTQPKARLVELEEQNYNTNHAVIGYYIASSWGLPPHICQLILRHHDKNYLDTLTGCKGQIAFAALKMAESIVSGVRHMQVSDGWHLIKTKVLDILGIDSTTYTELYDEIDDILHHD